MNSADVLRAVKSNFASIRIFPSSLPALPPPPARSLPEPSISLPVADVTVSRSLPPARVGLPLFPPKPVPAQPSALRESLPSPTRPQLESLRVAVVEPCSHYSEKLPVATSAVLLALDPDIGPLPVTASHLRQVMALPAPPLLLGVDLLHTPLPPSLARSALCLSVAAWLLDPDRFCAAAPESLAALLELAPPPDATPCAAAERVLASRHSFAPRVAALLSAVQARGLWRALELYSEYTAAQAVIAREGLCFSPAGLREIAEGLEREVEELQRCADAALGRHVQLSSPKQVSAALYGTDEHSTDVANLRALTATSQSQGEADPARQELLDVLLQYREKSKLLTAYVRPLLALSPGCVVARPALCVTGRIALASPAMQQIPPPLRHCFGAVPHHVLLSADWRQLELRIAAAFAGDSELLEALSQGDIFEQTAARVGCTRREAKAVLYGLIYGLSVRGLAMQLTVSETQAAELVQSVQRSYPVLCSWAHSCTTASVPQSTVTGRRRQRSETNRGDRQAINMTVQGTAADLLAYAVAQLRQRLREVASRICLTVHDEIIVQTPQEIAGHTGKLVREVMEHAGQALDASLPLLPVTLRRGPSWASLEDI